MPGDPEKDLITAHHEAGHAVAARLLGVPVGETAMKGHGSGQGLVPGRLTVKAIRESNLAWEHAVVARLGPETESLFFGQADPDWCQDDEEVVARLYLTFFASEMSDLQYRAELRSRTAKVIESPGFREAVKAVAQILLEKRIVCEEEVAEAIKATVHRSKQ
jgi:hypothetical protein